MNPVRAIYEHGSLRLLDPVDLEEGEQVKVVVQPTNAIDDEEAKIRAALADMNIQYPDPNAVIEDLLDDEEMYALLDAELKDAPSSSQYIIDQRGDY